MDTPTDVDGATPVTGRSQTDVVIQAVKDMITAGVFPPGSRLPVEKELAARIGVSRGSLREGVRALAIMGVLETRQGDGTYVTSLNPDLLAAPMAFMVDLQRAGNAAHLQSVRRVLEAEAASRAALRMSAEDIAAAAAILDRVDELLAAGEPIDHQAALDADLAFHGVIARASANPVLEALIEALSGRTFRARLWRAIVQNGVTRQTQAEHRAILREIQAGEPERARIQMAAHLLGVEDFIDAHAVDVTNA